MLSKEKRIKNTILALIVIILTFAGVIISIYETHLIKTHINEEIFEKKQYINSAFNLIIKDSNSEILQETNTLLPKSAKEALINNDRTKLYEIVKDKYDKLLKKDSFLKNATFILPEGTVFLKVKEPKNYGNKIDKRVEIVFDSIQNKKVETGFEVSESKITYSVVTPIYYEDRFIGVIKLAINLEYIIKKMNALFKMDSSLFVKKDNLNKSLENMQKSGEYIFKNGSKVIKDSFDQIDLNSNTFKLLDENVEYYITVVNLLNNKGEVTAKLLLYENLAEINEEHYELMTKNIIIIFLIIFILVLILNTGLNYFLKKIDELYLNILKKDKMMMQQSKLASMGEMIGNIAHQWRQPLSVISTGASSIKLQNELGILNTEILNNSVDTIVNSTKYLSQTINDFLNFVKNSREKIDFDIKENIDKNLEILKGSLKIHDIKVILNTQKIIIEGYPNELTQVFINIINNAKDALKEKNRAFRFIFISTNSDDNILEIQIRDNAGGIPEEIMDKIFDPYFTTKSESEGTGLGLYMSYRIVNENMAGKIEVENVEFEYEGNSYKGAEFRLILSK